MTASSFPKDSFDISNYLIFLLSDWLLDWSSEAPLAVVQCILWSRRFHQHKGKIFLKAVQFVQFDQFPPCARAKLRVNAQCSTTTNVQNNSSSKFWSEFISQMEETAWNYKRKTKQNIGCTAEGCWKNKSTLHITVSNVMQGRGGRWSLRPWGSLGAENRLGRALKNNHQPASSSSSSPSSSILYANMERSFQVRTIYFCFLKTQFVLNGRIFCIKIDERLKP